MSFHKKHKARRHAVQALYQTIYTGEDSASVTAQHLADMKENKVDADYFKSLTMAVMANLDELDAIFTPYLDRDISELTPIELCVLRLSTFELKSHLEIPYRVVINEGLELTKSFGTEDGFKFVNGVLDQVAKQLRAVEYEAKKAK